MNRMLVLSILLSLSSLACGSEKAGAKPKAAAETGEEKAAPAEAVASADGADGADGDAVEAPSTGEAPAEADTETGEPEELEPLPDTFEQVGVESCDQYVADYVACVGEKVPEVEREAQRRIIFDNVSAWKQTLAGSPAGEQSLQIACRAAREQAKRASSAWGCEW